MEQFIKPLKIFLNPLPGFLLDGIELHSDVIIINMPIFLHNQDPQFGPISWHWLQLLEPFFGSTSQIQLGDLEQLIHIEISHLGSHCEPLRPIIHILMVSSP